MAMEVKDLLKALTKQNVINIMEKVYGASYKYGTNGVIMFESVCHNSSSKKLYYYHEPRGRHDEDDIGRNFYCYVCNVHGNLIDLLEELSGYDFNGAVKIIEEETGLKLSRGRKIRGLQLGGHTNTDLSFLSIHTKKIRQVKTIDKVYDDEVLNNFSLEYPLCWYQEGIDSCTADKFDIRYYSNGNQAVIPIRNTKGELIGVRVRNFDSTTVDRGFKYMPLQYRGEMYRFPTSNVMYGLYENQDSIRKSGKVLIFESEKSVLQVDSFYSGNGVGLGVYGSNFSTQHRSILLSLGVREVTICLDKEYCSEWYTEEYKGSKEQKLMIAYFKKLKKICSMLINYFTIHLVVDFDNLLELKDSPSDKGKEVFEQLLQEKITICDVDKDFKEYFNIEDDTYEL